MGGSLRIGELMHDFEDFLVHAYRELEIKPIKSDESKLYICEFTPDLLPDLAVLEPEPALFERF